MSEFLNYKVNLTLRDGTISTGTITNVDSSIIALENAYQSSNPEFNISNLRVDSSQIADLKVIQLPPDLLRTLKNRQLKNQGPNASNKEPLAVLDDAIVFALGSLPTTSNGAYDSLRNTPRSKFNHSSTESTDWSNNGDVQDIKSSDFDFAANLAMFDKKSVFADFQKEDNVSPENRLVGHNKSSKNIKTPDSRKEKYDNDEMVLDSEKVDNWDNIGNEVNINIDKGRPNPKSTASYKESGLSKSVKLLRSDTANPIPLCSPVQLLEIERLSSEAYGMTPGIMTEVCASNLSQLINRSILGGSTRLSNKKNHNLPPLVLLLIGSGRCGSRALATGRHLSNHGIRVLAFAVNNEDNDSELSHQWNLFEKCGGKSVLSNVDELMDILNNQLDTPVELILDALQGYDNHLEDIFYEAEDQKTLRRLVQWCNESRQRSKVMSLDIPSGIDGGSGTTLDESLTMSCKWCVSMGLPIAGLVHAYKNGNLLDDIVHYLVDVGIPNKVYSSKGNLRKFDKVWFIAESSIKLDVYDD
ncbi:uncharacterized protein PRCAT00004941001 [Priceomyces carsonii]|uniref:uncharacterized protein n=1 Tax=Priceomyces carsonii TaxID=28549 RepID=UPI002EDA2D72|nr:unnamed protein product [Priceomyces carsonii]